MTSLKHLLQHADPLPREVPRLDGARERIRLAMLRAAESKRSPARLTRLPVLVGVLVAAIVAMVAYAVWQRGATPVFAAVRFEIRLAEEQPTPGLIVAQVGQSTRLVYLHPEIVVGNDDIAEASVAEDGVQVSVNVRFLPQGADRLQQATAAHVGRPIAILIDGRVVMTPTVRAPVREWAVLTGLPSRADAERIAEGIGR